MQNKTKQVSSNIQVRDTAVSISKLCGNTSEMMTWEKFTGHISTSFLWNMLEYTTEVRHVHGIYNHGVSPLVQSNIFHVDCSYINVLPKGLTVMSQIFSYALFRVL